VTPIRRRTRTEEKEGRMDRRTIIAAFLVLALP